MKAIVSGSHGCVAPFVIEELKRNNIDVFIFDRSKVNINSYQQIYNFIKESKADFFFHIATGPLEWLSFIKNCCEELDVKLIYTSSVSVFSENSSGPYYLESVPNATDDYGKYKIAGEEIVKSYNNSIIVRLGWQIGYSENSNNMLDYLIKRNREDGVIYCSNKWYPSCSFLKETSKCIVSLTLKYKNSKNKCNLFLLNSNRKYTFYDIAKYLNKINKLNLNIVSCEIPNRDDRMFDERVRVEEIEID